MKTIDGYIDFMLHVECEAQGGWLNGSKLIEGGNKWRKLIPTNGKWRRSTKYKRFHFSNWLRHEEVKRLVHRLSSIREERMYWRDKDNTLWLHPIFYVNVALVISRGYRIAYNDYLVDLLSVRQNTVGISCEDMIRDLEVNLRLPHRKRFETFVGELDHALSYPPGRIAESDKPLVYAEIVRLNALLLNTQMTVDTVLAIYDHKTAYKPL